jgi:hypothetical protein
MLRAATQHDLSRPSTFRPMSAVFISRLQWLPYLWANDAWFAPIWSFPWGLILFSFRIFDQGRMPFLEVREWDDLRVFKWNEWAGPGERLLWNRESGEHKNCTRWIEFREAGATVGLGEIMRCVLLYESSSGVKPLCYFEERWKIRSRSGCWFFERHSGYSDHVEVARVMDWTSPPAHPFGVKIPSRLEWDFTW